MFEINSLCDNEFIKCIETQIIICVYILEYRYSHTLEQNGFFDPKKIIDIFNN